MLARVTTFAVDGVAAMLGLGGELVRRGHLEAAF